MSIVCTGGCIQHRSYTMVEKFQQHRLVEQVQDKDSIQLRLLLQQDDPIDPLIESSTFQGLLCMLAAAILQRPPQQQSRYT